MNGTAPKIEIFAPFGVAFEWMKMVLFRPFDFMKWLTIAFAAFIAGSWGGGFNFSRLGQFSSHDLKYNVTKHGDWPGNWDITPWLVAVFVLIFLFIVALSIAWMWVSSRGRFVFTDCVVKNRATIAEPWREFRREGNSFFLFMLAVGMATLVLIVIAGFFLWGLFGISNNDGATIGFVIGLIVLGVIWLVFALIFAVVSQFMVPLMYRRRCLAREALVEVSKLIAAYPGPFVLFVLFGLVLAIAVGIAGTIAACLTCCIGGLPYISTVLLLPAIVWLTAFRFLFLRQFGDQYDVWAPTGFPQTVIPPSDPSPPAVPLPPPIAPA